MTTRRAGATIPLLLLLQLTPFPASTQETPSAVPSPEEFLGYPLGDRFTPVPEAQAYARHLATASPLVEYSVYGRTPEQRDLYQIVISSRGNLGRLAEIQAAHAELADPSTSEARAREIASRYPAVVYLSYGIHGNEPSSTEAALWTAWDLARPASTAAWALDSLVVVIDPVANPDGRARYVQWYRSVVGEAPNPNPEAREHREPWPTGRYNHYLFDLNRDWAWATQPETVARLSSWWRWNPLVHVDFHEMDPVSSYFFFPAATPINPINPEHVLRWGERFGDANARAFDARGWAYFTGDEYDLFYPGYGDSWPSLLGAVGMTYEQAGNGSAGLALARAGGDTLTLRDRVLHHWTSGITTLFTAAASKSLLVLDVAASQRSLGRGQPDVLLVPGEDTLRLTSLVDHLSRQGIVVDRAARPFRTDARPHPGFASREAFPAGTRRVRARQARGRLAATLLAPEVPLEAEESYDIGAWSLPYAYGVEAHRASPGGDAAWAAPGMAGSAAVEAPPAEYGYLIPGALSSAEQVVDLLQAGVRVRVLSREATLEGRSWPPGSWFVPALGNDSVRTRIDHARLGALAIPVRSGRAETGVDLGSGHVWEISLPRAGVLSGEGISPSSFGAYWYFLEQRVGLPFDALLLSDLADLDLAPYDVLVLPEITGGMLRPEHADALREYVSRGGRLIAVGSGAGAVAPLFEVPLRADPLPPEKEKSAHLRTRSDRRSAERENDVSGVILEVRVDDTHPLGWGNEEAGGAARSFVLHDGTTLFDPAPDVETVAYFPSEPSLVAGTISPANLERIAQGAWLVSRQFDQGSVTLFADDPLFRLFWHGAHRFLLSGILVGPRR